MFSISCKDFIQSSRLGSIDGEGLYTFLGNEKGVIDVRCHIDGSITCKVDPTKSYSLRELNTELGKVSQTGRLFRAEPIDNDTVTIQSSFSASVTNSLYQPITYKSSDSTDQSHFYRQISTTVQPSYKPTTDQSIFSSKPHPLDNGEHVATLFDLASHLMNLFPNHHIYGLGQSPAWILEGCKILQPNSHKIDHLAFSGGWFKDDRSNQRDLVLSNTANRNSGNYKSYLETKGFTPENIVSQHKNTGIPIVLVEHTHSGRGLKSFLEIMIRWSREQGISESQLKAALHVHILAGEDMMSFHTPNAAPESLFIKTVSLTKGKFLVAMSNSDDSVDRLVPCYPCFKWNREPDYSQCKEENIAAIKQRLSDFLSLQ